MEQAEPPNGIFGMLKQLFKGIFGLILTLLSLGVCAIIGLVGIFISPLIIIIMILGIVLFIAWAMKNIPKTTQKSKENNVVDGSAEYATPDEFQSTQLPQARKRK